MGEVFQFRSSVMAADDSRGNEARKKIARANSALADFQRDRVATLMQECLPAYEALREENSSFLARGRFELSSTLLKLLSGAGSADFADKDSALELEKAVESFAVQLRLHRKRLERDFDVFLSYNSSDRAQVATIAGYLQAEGLLPWFDQNELAPGEMWQSKLQHDIESVKSCAVIVGPSGVGPWQNLEIQGALQSFVD